MALLPPTLPTKSLSVEGKHVAFDDTGGSGPLILAIPGMGDLRSEYRHLRPLLVDAGYRVVTMDVRGFGESSAEWDDLSARAVGRDAIALIDHLDAASAVILGNSFASGSALWAAHEAPAKVRGVALLGPIVRDQKVPLMAKIVMAAGFAGPWRVSFWMTYWNSLFPARKPFDHAQCKARLATNLREPGRMDALRAMLALSKADTAAILAESTVPALIVMGTRDPDFSDPILEAEQLAELLEAETMIVDGSGHYPHTEFPETVAPRLISFMGKLA